MRLTSAVRPGRPLRHLLALPLLAATLLAPAPAEVAEANEEEDPRARLEALESELDALDTWLGSRRQDRDALAERIRAGDLALAEVATAQRRADESLVAHTERLAEITAELHRIEDEVAAQRDALGAQLRQAWLLSRRDPVRLALDAEAPDRAARLMAYHRYLAEARLAVIERWHSLQRRLDAQRAEAEAARAEVARRRERLVDRAQELEAARAEHATRLARIESAIRDREDSRTELVDARARLLELLERLARRAAPLTGESFREARGELPWPVDAPVAEAFGAPRAQGRLRSDGVLLAAEPGTAVRAVHAGRVAYAGWMRGFGLLLILDHGGGFMSLYGQAESLLREEGDRVEAGEVIATAGRSGGSARPGLWFQIREGGRPRDPVAWCGAPGRA